jgi:hypothetical protein
MAGTVAGVAAALGTPGKEAAQVRFGVITGRALIAGQVAGYCQPQLISERHKRIMK